MAEDLLDDLTGWAIPDVELAASDGERINLLRHPGRSVVFFYPYTGQPGVPDPPDWDNIPGAHGSTPQIVAYSKLYDEFQNRNVSLFGISTQEPDWQRELASRLALRCILLSDRAGALSRALALPVFVTGGRAYLKRLTLLVNAGRIERTRYPVPVPQDDAAAMLALLDA